MLFTKRIWLLVALLVMVVSLSYATTYPPAVSFVSPRNGSTISGEAKITISFSATAEHLVTKLELYVDRQLVEETTLDSPLLSGQQVYYINTLQLANGPHSLTAKAYSRPEDVGEATIMVYVNNGLEDITPPLVEILYPKGGQKLAGKVEVKIKAVDDREVKYVMLFIDDKFKFLKNYPPYTDIWDTTNYLNGIHILQAFAYDAAENKGESKPVKVVVDNPSGKTALGEAKTSAKEEITPPSIITPPSTPETKEAKGEALSTPAKGQAEPKEAKKDEGTKPSIATVKRETPPSVTSKGQAVTSPGAEPKEISKGEGTLTITLNLPQKETPPSTTTKGQSAIAGGATFKEAVKDKPAKEGKVGGVPVLPPVIPKAEAKSTVQSTPLESPGPSYQHSKIGGKPVVSAPPSSKPSAAKSIATPSGALASPKGTNQKTLLIVSKPSETLSVISTNASSQNSFKVHTIQKGECLFRIAKAYGVPWETIASLNNLENPDFIKAGEKLLVPNITVLYNENEVSFPDAHPFVKNDIPLVPFRAVFETAGGTVIWHADSREVEAHRGDKNVWLKIGSRKAQVNDQTILMEVAAFIKFNRTYVPATLFHYALDAQIQWDPQTGHLYISTP
ncbi:LysM peptidoglycan-binding domain-containing protein [bacterium]|nr:LysM peptidoglycan-binding domain-containing protein [bacterium]